MADYVKNSSNQNSIKIRSSSSHYLSNTKVGPQKSTDTVNRRKHPVQNHIRAEQKINITDEPTYRKAPSSSCTSKLTDKVLEDASIFEIQKLIRVVSWTELFPDKHHNSDSMQEIATSFVSSALDHDAGKKVVQNIRETQSKKPEHFDLELLQTHASNGLRCKNILEQMEKGTPVLSFPTQTIKDEQEHQEEREANLEGECEVKVHKYSTRKKATFQNSYIVCKGDYSVSTTVDLHGNLESYFWIPLNDSSDEKWADVLKTERHTLTMTHINPSSSTRFFKSDHVKHPSTSVLGDELPSARSASSFEKRALAAENLVEIKEKDTFKDFIGTLKSDNCSGTNDNAKSTAEQVRSRNNPFAPEAQKDELSFLDFQSQKKGTVQKKETKSARKSRTDKSFEENKYIGKEQTVNPSNGENCTGGQIELELQPLKKNPSTLTSCVEGDSVTQNPVPKYLQDDINEYVSENIIKSTVGPKSSSEEFFIRRVKVDYNKKLFAYDKFLPDSCNEDGILAQYYFYLDYLCHSKMLQPEESSHSFSCKEFHGFSQEEKLAARCHFNNSNRMKDADIEDADSDFGPCGKNCCKDKRAEVIRPSEEQESKSLFIDSCSRPLSHLASTDQRELGNLHSSKGKDSRQQHETAFQGDEEGNVKSNGDNDVLSWLLLPDELWMCIFSLLTHKDISQVSQVCHRFYQLAADESFWKEIKLVNCHCLNDDWLISLGSHHPQSFTLDHCHSENQRITEVGLKQFFQQCKGSLKELNVKNCSGPGLRGNTVLLQGSTFCNLLTTLDISWTGATDSGLIGLVIAAKSLQCLSANGCQITDSAVTALVEKHGKSLRKLEIFGCHALTAKCIRYVAMKCPNIKVLNIGRIHRVTEDCLTKVVNSMKKLTCLNITGLHTVKDCVVHFIAKNCPELECLVLNSCSQVTDISLMEISMYLPAIRYLDVSGCKEVTDVGVQALAGHCCKLSYLDLSSTATSKRGVCLLASFCFRTLECVKISFCKAITLDAVAKLCKNCKRLKILHLYGSRFIPDLEFIKKINKNVEVFHDLPVPAARLSSK